MIPLSYIGFIGGVCSLAGYVPYAVGVLKRKHPGPERASWLIWTLSSTLILLSYWEIGARTTIWVPLAYVIGQAFITILAFTHGREGWCALEKLAFIVAIISSIRWIYFDQPLVALILNLIIGFVGYIPGMWRLITEENPRSDLLDIEGWTLFFMGSIFNLFAVSDWTPVIYMVPVFMFIMNGITFGLAIWNSQRLENSEHRS
ncbi:MAG TPA: hypothetical protein VFT82_00060 [Candidatus Paceibacterota bacterium]|nr:hypothetical protein [Candidatus Paceibacterota bacterium]